MCVPLRRHAANCVRVFVWGCMCVRKQCDESVICFVPAVLIACHIHISATAHHSGRYSFVMAWLAFSLGESLLQRLDPHFDGVLPHTGRHLSEWVRLFDDFTVILLLSNVSDLRHSLLGPRIHGKIPKITIWPDRKVSRYEHKGQRCAHARVNADILTHARVHRQRERQHTIPFFLNQDRRSV